MSLLFCDSFDDRPIGAIGDRYTASGGGHISSVSAGSAIAPGRTGNGLVLSTGILDVFDSITYQFSSRQSVYVGVWWEHPGEGTALCSIRFTDIPHIYAQLNDDNTISVIRYGTPVTVLATSSRTVTDNFYVELYGKIDPTNGAYELRVNGNRWLSATGVNTSTPLVGNSLANQCRVTYTVFGADGHTTVIDDFYISDDDPDDGNAAIIGFAGPVKIGLLSVTGAGASAEWTPLSGANYTNVDDPASTGKDDDSTYNATLTEGASDLFDVTDLEVVNPTIKAVAVHQWVKKMDGTARIITPVTYLSGVEYPGDEIALGVSYDRAFHAFERNPATNLAWTRAEVSAAQFGIALATP